MRYDRIEDEPNFDPFENGAQERMNRAGHTGKVCQDWYDWSYQ